MESSRVKRLRIQAARRAVFVALFAYLLLHGFALSDALGVVLAVLITCAFVYSAVKVLMFYMAGEADSFEETLDIREMVTAVAFDAALYMIWDYGRRENEQDLLYCIEENDHEVAQRRDVLPLTTNKQYSMTGILVILEYDLAVFEAIPGWSAIQGGGKTVEGCSDIRLSYS